ncbi:MAG: heme-binding domain-containing protein [Chlorobiaceae bacterium]|nr:heme-binding domain-containing protein [Chlorobiaceae bacterium]
MNPKSSNVAGWFVLGLMLCQFVPLGRSVDPAPSRWGAIPLPERRVLEARCGQCHSNNTRWPNSAFVAPLSWFVVHEVRKARLSVNLQDAASAKKVIHLLIESGRAPGHASIPGFVNPELTPDERKLLLDWSSTREQEPRGDVKNSAPDPRDRTP